MASKGRKKPSLHDLMRLPMDSDAFFAELQGESDRACALIAASALSDILQRLLTAHFVELDATEHEHLFDRQNATLSSFSGRIEMAYVLGLTNKKERKNLDIIRNIRNAFAHAVANITFDTDEVATACKSLMEPDRPLPAGFSFIEHATNRQKFILSSMSQYIAILDQTGKLELTKLQVKALKLYGPSPAS